MKSPVKPKLMRILLDGRPHRGIDLATSVGFTKVATIRWVVDSFERARLITRGHAQEGAGDTIQLSSRPDIILKMYHNPEFHALRPEIRKAAWFCPLYTGNFSTLPGDLPELVDDMVRASHTFFETICLYDTPDKIRETFRQTTIVNRLAGISDPVFDELCMYYQIYLHSVIHDIRYGGLGEGFAELLSSTQEKVEQYFPKGKTVSGKKEIRPGSRQ